MDPARFAGGSSNLYEYVGNDPINYQDPTGRAKFCRRPLSDSPLQPGLGFGKNRGLHHEQLFFEDNETPDNQGWGLGHPKSLARENPGRYSSLFCDPPGTFDDKVMRQAVKNVETGEYDHLHNNCQHWADRLRQQYAFLLFQQRRAEIMERLRAPADKTRVGSQ